MLGLSKCLMFNAEALLLNALLNSVLGIWVYRGLECGLFIIKLIVKGRRNNKRIRKMGQERIKTQKSVNTTSKK